MDKIEIESARSYARPVDQILGKRTVATIRCFEKASAAILKRPNALSPAPGGLPDYHRLTSWRTLTKSQCSEIAAILTDPQSYWNGMPKYRRLPPRPGFAVQLHAQGEDAVLLIDLHTPGWEMYCGDEQYWGFNFAGPPLASLAKAIFPEYASEDPRSVWKRQPRDEDLIE
jgi:hypothetical protein